MTRLLIDTSVLGIPLISADRRLLAADLAESATEITARLRLSLN